MAHSCVQSYLFDIYVCVFEHCVCSTCMVPSIVYEHVHVRFAPSPATSLRHKTLGITIIIKLYVYKIFTYKNYYILCKLITGTAT